MRRFLIGLLALLVTLTLLWPYPGHVRAAAALVQQATNCASPGTSVVVTLGANVVSGNIEFAFISNGSSLDVTISSVTGLTGSTWSSVVDSDGQALSHKAIWIATGATTGTAVTVNISGNSRLCVNVSEFSGLTSTGDGTTTNNGNSTAPAITALTTTHATDLVLVMFGANTSATVSGNPPTGFTALTEATDTVDHAVGDYQVSAGIATYNAAWTLSVAAKWEAVSAAFQESGGAAAATPQRTIIGVGQRKR